MKNKSLNLKTKELIKRAVSFITAVAMVITILPLQPITAYAEETGTAVCTHHIHSEECGYVAAVDEVPCTHQHDEGCGFAAAVDEVLCECTETDENGAVLHTENCGYTPAAEEQPCTHTHDENCGFVAAVAGASCTWTPESCTECNPADDKTPADETLTAEPVAECICETDDETIHAANCPLYTPVENPQCFCSEKCSEETLNYWCDVCGVQGVAACKAEPEQSKSTYISRANTSSPVYYDDEVLNLKAIFAMGHPVTIEAGTSSGTAVWYMNGDTKTYINPNGAQGDDLSEFEIVGGGYETKGYSYPNGTTSITMKGGTVNAIIGGNFSGDFTGNTYIDVQGGTIEADGINHIHVLGGCYNDTFKGQTIIIVRGEALGVNEICGDDSSSTSGSVTSYGIFEKNVFYNYFDNVLIKQGSEWKITGTLFVPENYTFTIGQNESITIGANTSVVNNGSIVNNGTIYLNKPLDFIVASGNGSIVRNAAYIQTTDTSQPTVWVNGTQVASPKTEYADGKWFIYGLSGNVKATVGGQSYYGVVTANTPFELTTNYTVPAEISGIGNLLYAGSVLELNAVYSPAETTFPQTVSYSITDAGTTNAVLNGNTLTATAEGTLKLTVTVKDVYNTLSKDFIVNVKLTDAVDISKGDIIIEKTGDKLVVTSPFYAGGTKEFALSDAIKITGTTEQHTVTVKSGNPNIILENCNITSSTEKSPFSIESGNKVTLSLSGDNNLISNHSSYAGLRVPEGAELNIYGPGKLIAENKGNSNAAGIGGNDRESAGKIVINSGEITAVAKNGAAIGGGNYANAAETLIKGGTVNANSTGGGAGIGGGYGGSAGNITISGGTVNANSTGSGAAIGSGSNYEGDGGNITITSGTVTAVSEDGTGIGGGFAGNIENITISGGTVTAGGDVAIGSATWGKVGTITISGGTITANKDGDSSVSAGIGCGTNASCEAIVISGGKVYASGGEGLGAGIGSGEYNKYSGLEPVEIPITISGGTIVAKGGNSRGYSAAAAGIGGGDKNSGGNIIITGGNVKATAESLYTSSLAPVGPGLNGTAGTLTDGKENNVTENIVTISGIDAETAVTAMTSADNISYGLKDVYTTADGKLYLYWPDDIQLPSSITAGGAEYYHNGDKTYSNHHHNWQYTADEAAATITANCTAAGCTLENADGGSVKISMADREYNGNAAEAVVTNTLTTGDTYTVSYTAKAGSALTADKAVNAGEYTVILAVGGKSVSADFEIKTKEITADMISVADDSTYNGSEQKPTVVVKDGSTTLTEGENYTVEYTNNINATTDTSKAKVTVTGTGNYRDTVEKNFEIDKAAPSYTEPTGLAATYGDALADIALPDGWSWKDSSESVGNAGAKTFAAIFTPADSANYNIVEKKLTIDVAKATPDISSVTATIPDNSTAVVDIRFSGAKGMDGNALAGEFTVTNPGSLVWGNNTVEFTFTPVDANYTSVNGTVTVTVKDTIVPTGKVTVEENSWTAFLNEITFNIFFNKAVDVKVTANDTLSGVKSVEYIKSDEALTLDELKQIANWTAMDAENKVSVTAEDAKQFVYYIRITDNADNVTIVSTDGMAFDLTTPVITGVTNGTTYYTTQKFTVIEANLADMKVNDNAVTDYTLAGNVDATYKVVVTDKAGNSATITVTMKPISALTEIIKDLTEADVTGDDTDEIKAAEEAITAVDTTNATQAEKDEIAAARENIDRLQKVVEDTAAEVKALEDTLAGYDKDTVKSTDEAAVDQLIDDLTAKLEDANLSEEQKTDLTKALEDAQALAQQIDSDKEALEDAYNSVPAVDTDNVTADNAEDLAAAKDKLKDIVENDNYTEEQQKAAQEQIDKIEELEKVIEETGTSVDKAVAEEGYADKTQADITSAEKDEIEANLEAVEELLDTDNLTEEQRKVLKDTKTEAENLLAEIKENSEALDNALKAEKDTTEDNYQLSDKEDLKEAVENLKAVTDESNKNYTAEEKQTAQAEINRVESIIADIEETETVIVDITNAVEKVVAITDVKAIPDSEEAVDAVIAAQDDYDNLTDRQKELVGDTLKQNINDALAKITAYEIIHGADGKWTIGASQTLGFTANGLFKLFKEVRVDGNVLVKDTDYTAISGSTIVTLSKSYLDTLSVGKHKLEVVYDVLGEDHIADCEFAIKAKPAPATQAKPASVTQATPAPTDNVPKTGDSTNTACWMAIMLSSLAALAVVFRKKKEYEDR